LKLLLTEYDYTHLKYLTYLENTAGTIEGSVGIYPNAIVKSDEATITGKLKDITVLEGRTAGDDTYIEIPQGESIELTFKNADNIIGNIGTFSAATPETIAAINVIHQGESASSKYEIKYQHPDTTYYHTAEDKTPNTTKVYASITLNSFGVGSSFPLMMEGIITITNNSDDAEYIRIYDLCLSIVGTVKSGVQTKAIYAINTVRMPSQNPFAPHIFYPGVPFYKVRNLVSISQKDIAWDGDNIFATGFGRMYERWTDSVSGGARSNGRNEDDVIHQPAGNFKGRSFCRKRFNPKREGR